MTSHVPGEGKFYDIILCTVEKQLNYENKNSQKQF
jgi:hypothetical protein